MNFQKFLLDAEQNLFIIAEAGVNHNGDINTAFLLVDAAVKSGCDAVKFQSWSPKSLISRSGYKQNLVFTDSKKKHFGSLEEMVEKYYLKNTR